MDITIKTIKNVFENCCNNNNITTRVKFIGYIISNVNDCGINYFAYEILKLNTDVNDMRADYEINKLKDNRIKILIYSSDNTNIIVSGFNSYYDYGTKRHWFYFSDNNLGRRQLKIFLYKLFKWIK